VTRDDAKGELKGSVPVPRHPSFLRRLFAFSGPAYLVSVGYMDPGNWATDIAAGARFGNALIWVLLMSNLMAVLLQSLSARLGIVSRMDLAQGCRAMFGPRVSFSLWVLAELAITSTDLAEVLGSAIGLNLLFGLPLAIGVVLTGLDTFVLLLVHNMGVRVMEGFIVVLITVIGVSLGVEVVLSHPDPGAIAAGLVPSLPGEGALYLAIGMLGATVMPHNLYLHSALVQSRSISQAPSGVRAGVRFNVIDSLVALNGAFFVNAALLVMAAAVFHTTGHAEVSEIQQAHRLLEPLLGVHLAPVAFAVALIASGQSSTITGTLTGQIVMEGFLHLRLRPLIRRLVTRALALIPALVAILMFGERATGELLVLSQVVLSLQLSFAVIPLIHLVSDRRWMGAHTIGAPAQLLAWLVAGVIVVLNLQLAGEEVIGWIHAAGGQAWLVWLAVIPTAGLLLALLGHVTVAPIRTRLRGDAPERPAGIHGPTVVPEVRPAPPPRRICAAIDFTPADGPVLSHTLAQARARGARVVLLHVVQSGAARIMGERQLDRETRADAERLELYCDELIESGVEASCALGYGDSVEALAGLIEQHRPDMVIVGSHGHRMVGDLVHGTTVEKLRHRLTVPLLVVPGETGPAPTAAQPG
jgi:manganese transport protein